VESLHHFAGIAATAAGKYGQPGPGMRVEVGFHAFANSQPAAHFAEVIAEKPELAQRYTYNDDTKRPQQGKEYKIEGAINEMIFNGKRGDDFPGEKSAQAAAQGKSAQDQK
jgi:hypothetical protein